MNIKSLQESLINSIAKDIETLINEASEGKFILNKAKIRTVEITSPAKLKEIIADSEPDKDEDRGFWLFDEALKKDDGYLEFNRPPFYIHYIAYMYENTPVALFSFSTQYYRKNAQTEDEKKLRDYIRLMNFQTDSRYRGNDIQKFCIDRFCRIAKKYYFEGVTLTCYDPELCEKYKKDGFEGGSEFMWKTFEDED